jgi:hypothetical protein
MFGSKQQKQLGFWLRLCNCFGRVGHGCITVDDPYRFQTSKSVMEAAGLSST